MKKGLGQIQTGDKEDSGKKKGERKKDERIA
jgi:hypothetical protein